MVRLPAFNFALSLYNGNIALAPSPLCMISGSSQHCINGDVPLCCRIRLAADGTCRQCSSRDNVISLYIFLSAPAVGERV